MSAKTVEHLMLCTFFNRIFFSAGPGLLLLLLVAQPVLSQKVKADSLERLLKTAQRDSNAVRLMWQLAEAVNAYNPDTAIRISQRAVFLSQELKYTEGLSKSLGSMANATIKTGNFPRALELYFQKLKLEENRNNPHNLASVLTNLGIVYTMQEQYEKAKEYYYGAYAIMQQNGLEEMRYYILLNLGDVFNRQDNSDSSSHYFGQSLALARKMNDTDFIATSLTGLAHSYRKMSRYQESLLSYQAAINGLRASNDDEILCEAMLGLATLYRQLHKEDSAVYYAKQSQQIAARGSFLSHELEAAAFLAEQYKVSQNADSAFAYLNQVQVLNDSINSKTRIRESQILSTNEELRQLEIEENRKLAAKERHEQLQLLFIGIFIPGLFIFTLLLSRIKVHARIIKVLGVLSLLILFEYLTLLLHPYVLDFTHHTPFYEILIFVALAAVLVPAHHRIEHWLVDKLTRKQPADGIRLITKKIKIKGPSG